MATLGVGASGQTFFSGYVSGIDTQSLIQNAVNAKLLPRKRLDDRVTANTNKISAYQKIQTQSNALKSALDKLKSDLTLGNVFSGKQATYASSNPNVTAASVLTATIGSGAQSGNYDVVVGATAKNFVAQGTNQGSISTALNFNGSFNIGEAGKTAVTVTISNSDTLQDVANKINATSGTSGVSADILQVAPGQYRLLIRGADTNKEVSVSNITGSNVLNSLGVTDVGGTFTNVVQPPSPASITLNGLPLTSDTNSFSNVLTGISLNVNSASPGTTITVTVGNDTTAVKSAIQGVVDAYNTLRKSIDDLTKVNADGTVPDSSYLYNEGVVAQLKQSLATMVSGTYGSSTVYNGLRAIGVSIGSDNLLAVDGTALDNALKNNFSEVQAVFATSKKFSASSNVQNSATADLGYNGSFTIGEQGKGTVTINVSSGGVVSSLQDIKNAINAASTSTGVTARIVTLSTGESKLLIEGADDSTPVQVTSVSGTDVLTQLGLTSGPGTFDNNTTAQGLADAGSLLINSYANVTAGAIKTAISNFETTNTDLKKRSDAIKESVTRYQEELISRYAKLEAFVQAGLTTKAQIKAILEGSSPSR